MLMNAPTTNSRRSCGAQTIAGCFVLYMSRSVTCASPSFVNILLAVSAAAGAARVAQEAVRFVEITTYAANVSPKSTAVLAIVSRPPPGAVAANASQTQLALTSGRKCSRFASAIVTSEFGPATVANKLGGHLSYSTSTCVVYDWLARRLLPCAKGVCFESIFLDTVHRYH
jgi:hypothetical protein